MSKGRIIGGLASAIATILAGVYANEGGFVDNPNDPGGPTRYGVTQEVARQAGYHGDMRFFPKNCTGPADVCADGIYIERYIHKPGYIPIIELEPAVGEELVDSAVNFGPSRPSKWFQEALNSYTNFDLVVDGKIGRRTIAAFGSFKRDTGASGCVLMLDTLDAKQRAEYDRLVRVNPRLKVFHRGWIKRRVGNVERSKCGPVT